MRWSGRGIRENPQQFRRWIGAEVAGAAVGDVASVAGIEVVGDAGERQRRVDVGQGGPLGWAWRKRIGFPDYSGPLIH
jgi:hypothetical protein